MNLKVIIKPFVLSILNLCWCILLFGIMQKVFLCHLFSSFIMCHLPRKVYLTHHKIIAICWAPNMGHTLIILVLYILVPLNIGRYYYLNLESKKSRAEKCLPPRDAAFQDIKRWATSRTTGTEIMKDCFNHIFTFVLWNITVKHLLSSSFCKQGNQISEDLKGMP